jgi:hypothetical protein
LIFGAGTPDRRLQEIAALAALRERLRTRDVRVDGSRAFRPFDDHLMPKLAFLKPKQEGGLTASMPVDVDAYLSEVLFRADFALRRSRWLARRAGLRRAPGGRRPGGHAAKDRGALAG